MKFIITFAFLLVIPLACNSERDMNVKKRKSEVLITMSDSIKLATDVFVPRKKGTFPSILVRTPYNKSAEEWMGKAFNLFGIAVVIQDVRGKYKSGGDFYPFINERSDGLRTLRWIRNQPWSDGSVAGWGGSYVGYTQWAVSDSLDFMTLLLTSANMYDAMHPDSLFSLQTAFTWGFQNATSQTNSLSADKLKKGTMILPVSLADDTLVTDIQFVNDWIIHEKYDDYWKQMDFRGKTKAPLISMAGWYDMFLKSQISDFQAIEAAGKTNNRLVIGPWCHGSMAEPNDYGGLKKTGKPKKVFFYVKNRIKGKKDKLTYPLKDNKYNLFVMERNEYFGSDVWPPSETRNVRYFLGPSGYLDTSMFAANGYLRYEYSPSDPFRSLGGTALGDGVGPARQNSNTERKDKLSFEMPVENNPLILLGPVSATLWLSSSALCTDFFVSLHDEFPDGRIINIQEGGAKVKICDTVPGKTEISVWATGYQINPGHKLRVVITSSLFPRFNRSLNYCEPASVAMKMKSAEQKVYYGPGTPSSVNLPVYTVQSD